VIQFVKARSKWQVWASDEDGSNRRLLAEGATEDEAHATAAVELVSDFAELAAHRGLAASVLFETVGVAVQRALRERAARRPTRQIRVRED
jgi:hypothetical protein